MLSCSYALCTIIQINTFFIQLQFINLHMCYNLGNRLVCVHSVPSYFYPHLLKAQDSNSTLISLGPDLVISNWRIANLIWFNCGLIKNCQARKAIRQVLVTRSNIDIYQLELFQTARDKNPTLTDTMEQNLNRMRTISIDHVKVVSPCLFYILVLHQPKIRKSKY